MPKKKTGPDMPAQTSKQAPQSFSSSIKYDPEPRQRFSLYPVGQSPVKVDPTFDELMDSYRKGELKDVQLADLQMRMKKRVESDLLPTTVTQLKRFNVFNGQMFPDPEGMYTLAEALQVRALDTMQNPVKGSAESEKVSDILNAVHPYIMPQQGGEESGASLQDALLASIINNIPSSQDQLNTSLQISQMIEAAKPQPAQPQPPADPNAQIMSMIAMFTNLREIFAPPQAPASSGSTGMIEIGGAPVPIETMEKYFGLQMKIEDFNEKKRMMSTVRESIPQAIKAIGEMATGMHDKNKPSQQPAQQPVQQPNRKSEKIANSEISTGDWEKVICQEPGCGMSFLVPPGQGESVFCPKCSKAYLDRLNEQAQQIMSEQHEHQNMNGDNGRQKNMG